MSFNLERATSLAGDIVADYYLPKIGLNLLSRHLALKDLDRRIDAYCEDRGGVSDAERKRLRTQLAQELKQPRWDVYRFPALPGLGWRLPFFASLNIGTRWARGWAGAGDTVFGVAYGTLPEEGVLAGWGLAGLWAAAPHLSWTKNLSVIQNGAYSRAIDTTLGTAIDIKSKKPYYDNVKCKNDPPDSGGTPVEEEDMKPLRDTGESSLRRSASLSREAMVCSAQMAGGLSDGLADLLSGLQDSSPSARIEGTPLNGIRSLPLGASPSIPRMAPRVAPIVRAAPVPVP